MQRIDHKTPKKVSFQIYSILGYFWAGWWDEPNEGTFTDTNIYNKDDVGSTIPDMWQKSEPNGDRNENCAAMNR